MAGRLQRIVLIGAGNVGTHLAGAFASLGLKLVQVCSRHLRHAQVLAVRYGAAYTDNINALAEDADLYVFAVKDDALAGFSVNMGDRWVVHTSGAMPADVLKKVSSHYGVFYPLQTFTAGLEVDWKKVPVCIEASDEEMLEELKDLASRIAGPTLETRFEDRQRLHAAAVFVNNFTNYLHSDAEEIMKKTSLPFSVLQPLAEETIRKAFLLGPGESQTGPAVRGDEKTIAAHKELLTQKPDIQAVYTFLTEAIQKGGPVE